MNRAMETPHQPPSVDVQPPMVYVTEDPAWEYQHLVRNLETERAPDVEELNTLGAHGWELVGVFATPPSVHFYFKRLVR
ncbi:MAG: hypothetical protein GTN62_12000 [Gemmatimonadales bacterium]|nr:hypothetical protein [Gemmatimonadales bacterium]NIN12442.1 hypothetical protein [Gemmatimonadales bacterium]NIN50818.1 hypothetical protein [Gemmatimonadales bacterium]NIP08282.1 hypothetical protein [Gemmatimonadales bacterium]NIR00806.1 hypothetical protein [Gemmatimonadales bacterium]